MKKIILKHLTVTGYMKSIDLDDCEPLLRKLEDARSKLKVAKKDVKEAKRELNITLENSLKKIENTQAWENRIQNNNEEPVFASIFRNKKNKTKYYNKLAELERQKINIRQRLEDDKSDGAESRIFKDQMRNDLDRIEEMVTELLNYNSIKIKR